jgi:hypothetical protein
MNNLIKTPVQKEIVILHSALTQLNEMHNYCVMGKPKNQVMFNTSVSKKYYFILLIDFLSQFDEKIKKNASLLDLLSEIDGNYYLGNKTSFKKLGSAVRRFKKWLRYEDSFKKIWLPDIDKEVKLAVSREDLIRICANMNKHAFLKLSRIRKKIKKIFEGNKVHVSDGDIILCMENLYEWFYDDFLSFYSTAIAQHLIDIQWGVHEYLLPLYKKSYKQYCHEKFKDKAYKYVPPKKYNISKGDEPFFSLYWDLMNKVRSKPIFQRYKTPWYFKKAKVY